MNRSDPPPASPPDTAPPGSSAEAARADKDAFLDTPFGSIIAMLGSPEAFTAYRVGVMSAFSIFYGVKPTFDLFVATADATTPREVLTSLWEFKRTHPEPPQEPWARTESEGAGTPGRHETQTTSGGSNARLVIPKASEPRSF